MQIEVSHRQRSTFITFEHNSYRWTIERTLYGYYIYGESMVDPDKGFSTYSLCDLCTLAEAWNAAERLEKASDEFIDEGKRIAEKYGVSFVDNLLCSAAANYWYLEG